MSLSMLKQHRASARPPSCEARLTWDQLATILGNMADGVTVQDRAGRLTYANEAAARAFGFPSAAALFAAPAAAARQVEIRDEAANPVPLERLPGRLVLRGLPAPATVLRFRRPATGQEQRLRVTATPAFDRRGRVQMAVTVFHDITEHELAQADHVRLAALVESSDDAIIGKDLDGVITSWNPGAERLYGHTAAEAIGQPIALLIPPDRPDELPDIMARLRRGERITHYETVRLCKDGGRVDVSVSTAPVRDGGGTITGAATIARDITARKEAEAALRESEARFHTMADTAPVLIWMSDPDGGCAYVNQPWLDFTGRSLEQELGEGWAGGVHPDDRARCLATYRAALAAQREFSAEYRLRHADGGYRWLLDRGMPRFLQGGRFAGYIGSCIDITARKEAEEALRRSEARYRALVAAAAQVVWTTRPDGVVEDILYLLAYTGLSAAEVAGQGWPVAVHPEDRERVARRWAKAIAATEVCELECRIRRADGVHRPSQVRVVPVLGEDGSVREWVGTCTDIGDRKRAEDAQRFLAEASSLLAASLDYPTTLESVALLAVADLADWCRIDIVEEDGALHTLAVAHKDPAKAELARELVRRRPRNSGAPAGAPNVLRTGRSEVVAEIPDRLLEAVAIDEAHLRQLRELGLVSYVCVPLPARGRTLGALTFAAGESGRRYGPADLALAEDLARRVAVAIEHARLYAAEQRMRQLAERAAERTARLQAVSAALAEALTPARVAAVIVEQGMAALGARAGSVALLADGGGGDPGGAALEAALEVAHASGYPPAVVEARRRFPLSTPMPLADAVRTGEAVVLASGDAHAARYPHLAGEQTLTGDGPSAAIPLIVDGGAVGALGLSFAEPRPFSDEDHAFILALARQCAQALERARLYDAERRARAEAEATQRRLMFLSEASALLNASLDYRSTLVQLARLAVPYLADWCIVHVAEEDGSIHKVAAAHVDPAKEALLHELERRHPPRPDAESGVARVLRSGQPEIYPDASVTLPGEAAENSPRLALGRALGLASLMFVPLVAPGKVLGALTFAAAESGRHYGELDLALARDLAQHAASAVDNARLYGAAQQAGEQLSRQAAHLRVLAEAARAFAEASPDLRTTLETVTRQIVAVLADGCIIRLLSDDRRWLEPVSIHHSDPDMLAAMRATAVPVPSRLDEYPPLREAHDRERLPPPARPEELHTSITPAYWPDVDHIAPHNLLVVPLQVQGKPIGTLSVSRDRPYTEEDQVLLQDLADRAALSTANARLYSALAEREQRLQDLVGRLLTAQEEERRHVAYEIHDGLAQVAASTLQHLQGVAEQLDGLAPPVRAEFARAVELARRTVREARQIIADLRPTVLDDFGLAAALRLQVEERQADGWQIVYHETLGGERLPPMVETALFRVAQEALTNVRKHAGTTRVRITLARDAQAVYLTVHDRGAGFAPDAERRGGPPGERVGLAGMRERVALLGGHCQVDSRPGAGTRVVAWVPLAGQGEATDGYRDTPLHQ